MPADLLRSLLLRAGIESNPGPQRWWPCTVCHKNAPNSCIECSTCKNWVHLRCSGIKKANYNWGHWTCPPCSRSSNPFPLPPKPTHGHINIMQWNINGLSGKSSELNDFMIKNDIHVAALQETKLSASSKLPALPGFAIVRQDRSRHGGGLAFFIHHSIKYSILPVPPGSTTTEQLGITIHLQTTKLELINLYIPPPSSCVEGTATPIDHLLQPNKDRLVLGDMNGHDSLWYSPISDNRGSLLAENINDSSYGTLNLDSPTRLPVNGQPTSPDITIASSSMLLACDWTVDTDLASDHLPITVHILTTMAGNSYAPRKCYTNFAKADWDKFYAETEELAASFPLETFDEVEAGRKALEHIITTASKHAIPRGKVKNFVPCLSRETKLLIQQRNDLRVSNPSDPRIAQINSEITRHIAESRRSAWHKHVESCSHSTQASKHWKIIKSLNGQTRPPPNSAIVFNDVPITSSSNIANNFTKLFTRIRTHRQDPETRRVIRKIKALSREQPVTFSEAEVRVALRKTKTSKASGPDGVTNLHLKHLGPASISRMTRLFNASIARCQIPRVWKRAVIVPLLKPGKPANQGSSYRPISLLSPVAKTLERLILPRLLEAFPPTKMQHGFRAKHSTTTALLNLTSKIALGFNQRPPPERTVTVALDLTKAFDSVNITTLIKLLLNSTLHPSLVRWLSAYLRGRQAVTSFRNSFSSPRIVRTGVPQGGVLSPTLFNAYLSDFPVPTEDGIQTLLYADDITVSHSSSNIQESVDSLNPYLDDIRSFLVDRDLMISTAKSSVTLFTPDTREFKLHPQVLIQDALLPLQRNPKILGVVFDPSLSFKEHVKTVCSKVSRRTNILRSLSGTNWGQQLETQAVSYKAIGRSVLNYAAPIWAPLLSTSNRERLQRQQNIALRVVTGCHAAASADHLSRETNILPITNHSNMLASQYLAQCLAPSHPCHDLLEPQYPRTMKHTIFSAYREPVDSVRDHLPPALYNEPKPIMKQLHTNYVEQVVRQLSPNPVLHDQPPSVDPSERQLPRPHRARLSQLRSGHCSLLNSFRRHLNPAISGLCLRCRAADDTVEHLFDCRAHPTPLSPITLWTNPREAIKFINGVFDPGGN